MSTNDSPLSLAYAEGNAIIADGLAGFRFIVTLSSGKTYDVCPLDSDPLAYPTCGIFVWQCQHGDNRLIINIAR